MILKKILKVPKCFQYRNFAYEDTYAYKVKGPKKLVMTLHPILMRKPREDLIDEAEEALGLARAARWNILPGPSEPRGGWDEEALMEVDYIRELKRLGRLKLPSEWHYIKDEGGSEDEFDLDDDAWNSPSLRKQWAESCLVSLRHPNPSMFFGTGKMAELSDIFIRQPCHVIFVNSNLTPRQIKMLEALFNNALKLYNDQQDRQVSKRREMESLVTMGYSVNLDNDESTKVTEMSHNIPTFVEVMDRARVVLEIFATRARSRVAILQVSLARCSYLKMNTLPGSQKRLQEIFDISKHNSGNRSEINAWATDQNVDVSVDLDRNTDKPADVMKDMMDRLGRKMRNELQFLLANRKRRRDNRSGAASIALVGYTNSGKTALINCLTGSDLTVKNLLFQTLDTTFRKIKLPSGGQAVIADSIGFIQDLPAHLYDSFKATVEEILDADVLLHVRDVSHRQFESQRQTVISTLLDSGLSNARVDTTVIEVWNKIDLLPPKEIEQRLSSMPPGAVPICAKDGSGTDVLLQVIDQLMTDLKLFRILILKIPMKDSNECFKFWAKHNVVRYIAQKVTDDGEWHWIKMSADPSLIGRFCKRFNYNYNDIFGQIPPSDLNNEEEEMFNETDDIDETDDEGETDKEI
eukprot:GHVL01001128.1.p1 GENE.GHVL01001128.1~~GHVL01001128.1.p1  ORF type:complete len:636 (-),score=129.33 GHVL01001128.1:1733-3640(-)